LITIIFYKNSTTICFKKDIIEISYKKASTQSATCQAYFSIIFTSLPDPRSVLINCIYAQRLSLEENSQLTLVKTTPTSPLASSITIVSVSLDDWQILELNLEAVQDTLLDQIRVVYTGQELPVWLDERMRVFVKVEDIEPDSRFARINGLTRVNVREVFSSRVGIGYDGNESVIEEWIGCFDVNPTDESLRQCQAETRRCEWLTTVELGEGICQNLGLRNVKGKL